MSFHKESTCIEDGSSQSCSAAARVGAGVGTPGGSCTSLDSSFDAGLRTEESREKQSDGSEQRGGHRGWERTSASCNTGGLNCTGAVADRAPKGDTSGAAAGAECTEPSESSDGDCVIVFPEPCGCAVRDLSGIARAPGDSLFEGRRRLGRRPLRRRLVTNAPDSAFAEDCGRRTSPRQTESLRGSQSFLGTRRLPCEASGGSMEESASSLVGVEQQVHGDPTAAGASGTLGEPVEVVSVASSDEDDLLYCGESSPRSSVINGFHQQRIAAEETTQSPSEYDSEQSTSTDSSAYGRFGQHTPTSGDEMRAYNPSTVHLQESDSVTGGTAPRMLAAEAPQVWERPSRRSVYPLRGNPHSPYATGTSRHGDEQRATTQEPLFHRRTDNQRTSLLRRGYMPSYIAFRRHTPRMRVSHLLTQRLLQFGDPWPITAMFGSLQWNSEEQPTHPSVLSQLPEGPYVAKRRAASASDGVSPEEGNSESCAICLDSFNEGQRVRYLPCVHFFHTQCVDTWLRQRDTCPVCKWSVSRVAE